MHAIPQMAVGVPGWQSGAAQRLRASMAVSVLLLAAMLSLVRLPAPLPFVPLLELVVELARPALPPERVEPPQPPVPQTVAEITPEPVVTEPAPAAAASDAPVDEGGPVDWEAIEVAAIKAVLDAAEREANYSINPPLARARREASVRFRASLAPGAVNAWDDVEKDQLGRTILRLGDGNCFQVLDDPSGVNRWAFETFDKHVVYCDFYFGGKQGRELPWVQLIRERYPYLRDPVPVP
ncbi:MAG: hypothetical protein OEV41_06625 [Gammaproteobacteria bacterium]|nr:hypothetical protein [Gammaproteobacteria bacterium]